MVSSPCLDGAVRAIQCAASMGAAVRDLGIEIRAGLHTGEVTLAGGTRTRHGRTCRCTCGGPRRALARPATSTTQESADGSGLSSGGERGSHELKRLRTPRRLRAPARGADLGRRLPGRPNPAAIAPAFVCSICPTATSACGRSRPIRFSPRDAIFSPRAVDPAPARSTTAREERA